MPLILLDGGVGFIYHEQEIPGKEIEQSEGPRARLALPAC